MDFLLRELKGLLVLCKTLFEWLNTWWANMFSMFLPRGEMPIEELMKMYSAAENESTDLQSDEESSQESSEEGIAGVIALLKMAVIFGASLILIVCLF